MAGALRVAEADARFDASDGVWTAERIEACFEAAGRALRRLPGNDLRKLGRVATIWPQVQDSEQDWMAQLGRVEGTRGGDNLVLLGVTQQDANALDRVLEWLWWLAPGESHRVGRHRLVLPSDIRKIMLSRAMGASWRLIQRMRESRRDAGANSHEFLRRSYRAGIGVIGRRLNGPVRQAGRAV
jgi:hypothetical protein